jgi:hypothetical protein
MFKGSLAAEFKTSAAETTVERILNAVEGPWCQHEDQFGALVPRLLDNLIWILLFIVVVVFSWLPIDS